MAKKPYTLINDLLRDSFQQWKLDYGYNSLADIAGLRQYRGGAEICTIVTRFGKQLWNADKSSAAELHVITRRSFIEAEFELGGYNHSYDYYRTNLVAMSVRAVIASWIGRRTVPLRGVDYLPPGETVISSQGRVSITRKLEGPWTITESCYHTAIECILRTRWLRWIVAERLREHYQDQLDDLKEEMGKFHGLTEFEIYANLCRPLFTFVKGSRFSSVPKDTTKRRTIDVQPLWNVILQHQVGDVLRKVSFEQGNDLNEGQLHHREMIADPEYVTIDFSGASDSISEGLARYIFPRGIWRSMEQTRTSFTYVGDDDSQTSSVVTEGGWLYLNKLSSMGNGFTFEALTITLLACARRLDKTARVYGDDVIIKKEVALQFIRDCEQLGFKVNKDKSFIKYDFRESCGAFMIGDHSILSYEIDMVTNVFQLMTCLNKLMYLHEYLINRPWPICHRLGAQILRVRRQIINIAQTHRVVLPYGPHLALEHQRYDEGKGRYRFNIVPEDHVVCIDEDEFARLRAPVNISPQEHATVRMYVKNIQGERLVYIYRYKRISSYDQVDRKRDGNEYSNIYEIAANFFANGIFTSERRLSSERVRYRRELTVVVGPRYTSLKDVLACTQPETVA